MIDNDIAPDLVRACTGLPTSMFYPEGMRSPGVRGGDDSVAEPAKAVCRACDDLAGCEARHAHERDGVFFATTPVERDRARRAARAADHMPGVPKIRRAPVRDTVFEVVAAAPVGTIWTNADLRVIVAELGVEAGDTGIRNALYQLRDAGIIDEPDVGRVHTFNPRQYRKLR